MSLRKAFQGLGSAVLAHVRVPAAASTTAFRGFAAGTYLNKDEVTERIISVVKNFDKVDPAKVTPAADFQKDLGLDSLDVVDVVMAFEEEFAIEIPDAEADKILSMTNAIDYLSSHPQAK